MFRKCFCICLAIFVFIGCIYSQQRSDLEARRKEKLIEIKNIQELIDKTKLSKNQSYQQIGLLVRKIEIRNEIISDLSSEISDIDITINILSEDIGQKNSEIEKLKSEYSLVVYNAYFQSKNYNKFLFIFSSNSFNQAYRRLYFLKQYTIHRKNVLNRFLSEIVTIENNISELKVEKEKKTVLLASREEETKRLENDQKEQKQLISDYSRKEGSLKNELKELQVAAKRIEQEIERIIREEALAKQRRSKKAVSDDIVLTKNFAGNKGKLPWPVSNGSVVSFFGEHPHSVFKGIIVKNNGIDISTNCNNGVLCIFNGVVSKIFAIKGANYAIIIRHGDFLTVYQNVQKIAVEVGQKVTTKQVIGYSFCNSENSVSTVHFEIWQELNKLNPSDWLYNRN